MRQPQKCCALTDIMVNQAVEIHEQQDSLYASRSKIASDDHNVSRIKLDVEEVGQCEGHGRCTSVREEVCRRYQVVSYFFSSHEYFGSES